MKMLSPQWPTISLLSKIRLSLKPTNMNPTTKLLYIAKTYDLNNWISINTAYLIPALHISNKYDSTLNSPYILVTHPHLTFTLEAPMASSLLLRFPGALQTQSSDLLDYQGVFRERREHCFNEELQWSSKHSASLRAMLVPPVLRQTNRPPGPSPESPRLPTLLIWVRNTWAFPKQTHSSTS